MSFGVLKYGEKCARHPAPKVRGMDGRAVIYTDISGRKDIAAATGRKPVLPQEEADADATHPLLVPPPPLQRRSVVNNVTPDDGGFVTSSSLIGSGKRADPRQRQGSAVIAGHVNGPTTPQGAAPFATSQGDPTFPTAAPSAAQPAPSTASSVPVPPAVPEQKPTPPPSRIQTPTTQQRRRSNMKKPVLKLTLKRPPKDELMKIFKRIDFNGNGMLSLAELDKAVIELWPQYNNKPAIMRAYKACDVNNSGFVGKQEFNLFFLYIQVFDITWHTFSQMDVDGDRRLTVDEFVAGSDVLRPLGIPASEPELRTLFGRLDTNHGGFVLFDEFCAWFAANAVERERKAANIRTTKSKPKTSGTEKEFLDVPSAGSTAQLFNRLDFNGNGMLSLAELDKAIVELWPRFNNKPAILRAYKACDANGTGFISKREFRSFLEYLVVYQNLWARFELIDTSDDRRVTMEEFVKGKKHLGPAGLQSDAACETLFRSLDRNSGGYVLFDEFCAHFANGALKTYRTTRKDDPKEVTCVGMPAFCYLCGHHVSYEHLEMHRNTCAEGLLKMINDLPSFLRFPVPAPPTVEPKDPASLQEYNDMAKDIFKSETTRQCPECNKLFSVATLKSHFRKHTLSISREKELRRAKTKSPPPERRRKVASIPEKEPERLGGALVAHCPQEFVKPVRKALDYERATKPMISRRDFELMLHRCNIQSLIPLLDLGKTFSGDRKTVPVQAIMTMFPADALPSPKKKFLDPTKVSPAPNAHAPRIPGASPLVVTILAKFVDGEVEKVQLENPSGCMKSDKASILRRLRMMGYQDIQSVEIIQ